VYHPLFTACQHSAALVISLMWKLYDISILRQHWIFDMSTFPEVAPPPDRDTVAIGALVLVPIVIVVVVAFVAIKTTEAWDWFKLWLSAAKACVCGGRRRSKRAGVAGVSRSQDSFHDLESIDQSSHSSCGLKESASIEDLQAGLWHPRRSTRLNWSFGKASHRMSKSLDRCELPSVQIPQPVAVFGLRREK
jgi:hypothetical protein